MLSKFSVRKPYTIIVAVILVLVLGFVSFTSMTTDLLPSIDLPYAVIMTTYIGASPEEVELTVTKPIEQSVATINNINNISSVSSENYSMVICEFTDNANMDSISMDIRESIDMIRGNWNDSVGSPIIMKLNPDMMPVLVSAVDVDGLSTVEISSYVSDKVQPQIESVNGVASVSATGLIEEKINVVINENKIEKVNKKVRKAVKNQMKEAEEQLNSAKEEIESGKSELESKQSEFNSGMEAADQGITSGRLEIVKQEVALESKEEELAAAEAQIENGEIELAAGEDEIEEQERTLRRTEQELTEKKKEVETALAAIKLAELTLKEGETLSEEMTSNKAKLEVGLVEIENGMEQVKEGKRQIRIAQETLKENKQKLEESKQQIAQGKEQIAQGKEQLAQAKSQLDTQANEITSTKNSVSQELSNASNQLVSGEEQLNEQINNFKTTKKEAIKSADVTETITSDMVSQILQAQNFAMPAGYVTENGVDYLVRVGDKITKEKELKNLILFDMGMEDLAPVTLSDVADVFITDNSDKTYAKINGNDGVILSIQKQNNFSTAEVSDAVAAKFSQMMEEEEGLHVTNLMDQGMYIDLVVNSVLDNLIMGAILAIIILFLFLRDLKPTFIIACSIPISVVFAIVLMYFSGVTLNIISLSGLAVGVGMLVDNSVVVIENIYRLRGKGHSAIKAAVSGASQVSGAIIASTLTTVCVFLPIVFVEGLTRQLFMDMALTIGYSLLASLIVALTLVPAMASNMLKVTKEKQHKLFDLCLDGYEWLLRKALRVKWLILLMAVALLVGSAMLAMRNGTAFMPSMDSTQVSVNLKMPEGSVLAETIAMSNEVVERITSIEDVETVGAMLGGNSIMGMGQTSETSITMYAILKEDKTQTSEEIAKQIEELCSDLNCELSSSGSSMDMSALGGSGVAINIKGSELEELQRIAGEIASIIEKVPGTKEVSDGMENPAPEIKIVIDKEKAMKEGLTVAQAYMDLQSALSSSTDATNITTEGIEYPVVVVDQKSESLTREDIRNYKFKVTKNDGTTKNIKLSKIASITDTESLSSINRESQQRYITVSAAIADGYNVGLVSVDIEDALKDYNVSTGYEIEFAGENETINEALYQLLRMLLLAVIFIYLIMVAQFQSFKSPTIVMFTIPLAFTGGFLGLWLTKNEVSVISMIGFVMLSGIVVNNGIVLVDYINQLRLDGIEKKEAIVEAGMTRMRPILMTALTTILGLSTMALGVGMGADMMQPIAIVTIGGLLYATFTTLFVIPSMYDIMNRKELRAIDEDELTMIDD